MLKKTIITLIIILLVVAGLFFFFIKQGFIFKTNTESSEALDVSQPTPTPTSINVDFDDQSVLTTKDSKLQMIYPTVWQVEDITTQNSQDIIQAINLSSPDEDIQVSVEISQQYNQSMDSILGCENNSSIICESVINNTRPAIIEKSLGNNPQTINIRSVFSLRIFRLNFTIENNANQAQNIETVNKIIATIKFF